MIWDGGRAANSLYQMERKSNFNSSIYQSRIPSLLTQPYDFLTAEVVEEHGKVCDRERCCRSVQNDADTVSFVFPYYEALLSLHGGSRCLQNAVD